MENPEFLALNLKRLMDGKGWSYKQFAIESGVSYHTIFRAISLGTVPRGGNLRKLAKALGVSVSDLWREPTEQPAAQVPSVQQIMAMLDDRLPDAAELAAKAAEIAHLKSQNEKLKADMEALTARFRETTAKPPVMRTPTVLHDRPPKPKK